MSSEVRDRSRAAPPSSGSEQRHDTETIASAELSRSSFLRRVALSAATVFVVADGVVAYRAYDQGVLSEGRGPAFRAVEDWRSFSGPKALVAAAVLASSAHNTQPWLFAVRADQIDLYADTRRATGANDALQRELFVSLGCAIENMVIAARANGYDPEVVYHPTTDVDLVTSLRLGTGPPVKDSLYDALPHRRSNRSKYNGDPLPAKTLATMTSLVDDSVAPAKLQWLDTDTGRERFGAMLVDAARAHVDDDEQSRASFLWWRSDWDAVQQHKDGLTIDGVGLPPLVRSLGKILPATSRTAADKTFIERTKIQVESAGAFGIITVSDPYDLSQQLAGGRLLERLHLWAAANDVGFQHMNQITERVDRDRQLGKPDQFGPALAELAGPGVLAAFRIGTPTLKALASPRRPVKEVLR
jgi:hypothetical protein